MPTRRLREGMTYGEAATALAENNAGASIVLGELVRDGLGDFMCLLDQFGIYGHRIHILSLQIAPNTATLTALLYAAVNSLADMSPARLNTAIDTADSGRPHGIDIPAVLLAAVQHKLSH